MATHINDGRTDQRLELSGIATSTTVDIEITLGAGGGQLSLPGGGGHSYLIGTKNNTHGNRIHQSSGTVYIYNTGTELQVDSGTIYTSTVFPSLSAFNALLVDGAVVKIQNFVVADVLNLFNNTNQDQQDVAGSRFDVTQIVVKLSSNDSVMATFDLTTPAAQYTDSGYTLDFINYAASDSDPPEFTVAPSAGSATGNGHTISATVDEDGVAYAVRLASGATAPTPAQIKAGTDAGDVSVENKNIAVTGGAGFSLIFDQGSVTTEYDYYIVVEDGAGNIQDVNPANKVTATTTAGSFTIDGGQLQYGVAFTFTYTGMASVASPIVLGPDSQGNSLNIPITDNGVVDNVGTGSGTMPSLPPSGTANLILIENDLQITATEV